ncbi:MAG TPA: hypothetical protein VK772_08345 [Puia sp.]|jgi:hypothetical protein|nr:hypothetical protein [Puia sp.]
MTNYEQQLIRDYLSGKNSRSDFLIKYPIDLTNPSNYIIDILLNALKSEDSAEVDYGMSLIPFDKDFKNPDKYVDILCQLLSKSWHTRHEDIVALLQGIKAPQSVDALYKAALAKFDYLNYDDTHSLARKSIHALADINTEDSLVKLKLLANSNIEIIKEKAKKQLSVIDNI